MRMKNLLKLTSMIGLVFTVAVGCTSTSDSEQTEAPVEQKQPEIKTQEYSAPAPSTNGGQYSVNSGDNLWDISAKADVYNNPYQWPLIYKANSGKIKDADLIFPGQVFDIATSSPAEVNAAVTHAKTRGAWSLGAVEDSDKAYLAQ